MLEDFGRKNGTFHGGEKVISPVALADDDSIRIESQVLTFRARTADSTEPQVESAL